MQNWAISSVILNVVLALVVLVIALVGPGSHMASPWDGPSIATLVLTAATLMLAGVAVIAGLLAVWGFTTLREHAGNIAKQAAAEAMPAAAEAAAERVVKHWLGWSDRDVTSNEIAEAYGRENEGHG